MTHRSSAKRLNTRLVLSLLVTGIVVSVGIYFLHGFQVGRTADALLVRAEAAQRKGDRAEAIRCYRDYWNFRPNNPHVASQLAILLAEEAETSPGQTEQQAVQLHELLAKASIRDPNNLEVLRWLAQYSVRLRQWSQAKEQLNRLIKARPEESEHRVTLARCLAAQGQSDKAITSLQAVVAKDPKCIDGYIELAGILDSQADGAERARQTLDRMIEANPQSAEAYRQRALCHLRHERKEESRADAAQAVRLAPNDIDVCLLAAELAVQDNRLDDAQSHLERARKQHAADPRLLLAMARCHLQRKRPAEAVAVLRGSNVPSLLVALAEIQIQQNDIPGATQTIQHLRESKLPSDLLAYLDARVLCAENKWREACYRLERLRPAFVGKSPEYLQKVDLLLGAGYERLGDAVLQLKAYDRVLAAAPDLPVARLGRATALARLPGRGEEALREFQRAEALLGMEKVYAFSDVRSTVYGLYKQQALRLPAEKRDWKDVETFLGKLQTLPGMDPVERVLFQVDYCIAKGDLPGAQKLVDDAAAAHPDDVRPAVAKANLLVAAGSVDEALGVLAAMETRVGAVKAIQLARVALSGRMERAAALDLLAKIQRDAATLPKADRKLLLESVGSAYFALRDLPSAERAWHQLAALVPDDPRPHMALFELARAGDSAAGMAESLRALQGLLGRQSAEWSYCEAARLVWQARREAHRDAILSQAKQLLREAGRLHRNGQEVAQLRAEIAALEGNLDEAIAQLRAAAAQRPLGPAYWRQLVDWLVAARRYAEASEEIARLRKVADTRELKALESEVAARLGRMDAATETAAEFVTGSRQPVDYLWYGQLLFRAGKRDEAVAAFRKATELAPDMAQGWMALIETLAASGSKELAAEAMRASQLKLPENHRLLVLAFGSEILGDLAQAEQNYVAAASQRPDDIDVCRLVARFFSRTRRSVEAEKYWRRVLELGKADPSKNRDSMVMARRELARLVGGPGAGYSQQEEALSLLEQNASDGKLSPEDKAIQAALLALRPDRAEWDRAVALLEEIRADRSVFTPNRLFLLASLYEKTDRWDQCRQAMRELVSRKPEGDANQDYLRYLSVYALFLLKHDEPVDQIRPWVTRMREEAPDKALTQGIQVRLLVKEGRLDEAFALLDDLVNKASPDEQPLRLREAALLLEEVGQYDAARRRFETLAGKTDAGKRYLGEFLARRGVQEESLDSLAVAREKLPASAILPYALEWLKKHRATPDQIARIAEWFDQAEREEPGSSAVQFHRASFYELRGDDEKMLETLRAFLKRDDVDPRNHALVANNLAYLLAVRNREPQEAVKLIESAIQVLDPLPELLDTKGVVLLAAGQNQAAIEALRRAVSASPSGLKHFHLALAYLAENDLPSAKKEMQTARDTYRFAHDDVPLAERDRYEKAVKRLAGN